MIESEESRSSAWILVLEISRSMNVSTIIRIDGQHLFVMQSKKLKLTAECSKCMVPSQCVPTIRETNSSRALISIILFCKSTKIKL